VVGVIVADPSFIPDDQATAAAKARRPARHLLARNPRQCREEWPLKPDL
jgi:hypothetical protein